jgi:hypothetical protein
LMGGTTHRRNYPMRTMMALLITGAFAISVVSASAATVVTKNGTYQGGCSGSSCLYKPMKAPKSQPAPKPHKAS